MKTVTRKAGVVLALTLFPALAYAKLSQVGGGGASFSAEAFGGLNKIEGKTGEVRVAEDGDKVTVTVPLGKLDTGIDLRNKHMREKYLEVGKHPNATLTVARSALKVPSGDAVSADATGQLTLHGVTKDVKFHYTAKPDGDGFAVSGRTTVNIKDFKIEEPTYLGVGMKPNVTISVNFKAKDG